MDSGKATDWAIRFGGPPRGAALQPKNKLSLLTFRQLPILHQLQLEEALLRIGEGNWVIINQGSPPAIVMGISGRADELLHLDQVKIPVIRRYSGGGTVVVDEQTLFVSLIGDKSWLDCEPFPRSIMEWSSRFYSHVEGFSLRENDYVIGQRKFGGNAQSITRNRFVHHSTLLWDYSPQRMALLKNPQRQPEYRQRRSHEAFLCRIKELFVHPEEFLEGIVQQIAREGEIKEGIVGEELERPHRRTTRVV